MSSKWSTENDFHNNSNYIYDGGIFDGKRNGYGELTTQEGALIYKGTWS